MKTLCLNGKMLKYNVESKNGKREKNKNLTDLKPHSSPYDHTPFTLMSTTCTILIVS